MFCLIILWVVSCPMDVRVQHSPRYLIISFKNITRISNGITVLIR